MNDPRIGSLTDPKVRKATRDGAEPVYAEFMVRQSKLFIESDDFYDGNLLNEARDFLRWYIAVNSRKTGHLTTTDYELMIALLCPILARFIQVMSEVP